MDSFEIRTNREGGQGIVHRKHDLSGTDYHHVVSIPRHVADALDRDGVALWSEDAVQGTGRPGLVLSDDGEGRAAVEIRADVADPTTVIAQGSMDSWDARSCVGRGESHRLRWLIPPRDR